MQPLNPASQKEVEADLRIQRFFAGNSAYAIRRAYGVASVQGNSVLPAIFLNNSVDQERKSSIEAQSMQVTAQIDEIVSRGRVIESNIKELEEKYNGIGEEKVLWI